MGSYGYRPALTPALDGLAARGVLFEQAYTSCPLTLPAHTSLFTGLLPPEHAVRVNGKMALDPAVETLAERLGARGYRTGAFVAAAVVDHKYGLAQGFEVYDDDLTGAVPQEHAEPLAVYRPGNLVADRALAWLDDAAAHGPFLCWIHLYDAHSPDVAHPELDGTRYAGVASYDAEIAFADLELGRVLAFLREHDLERTTLVVVAGDHGEGLGDHGEREHGYLLSEEALHVPLVVALPGVAREGVRVPAVVSLLDVFPTVLELAHAGAPTRGSARSLVPALAGGAFPSVPSYAETDLPWLAFRWGPQRSLTTTDWKYVRSVRPELYDRVQDPGERRNLAPSETKRRDTLNAELERIEGGMTAGTAQPAAVTAEDRAKLAALGYVGGDDAPPTEGPTHDVKDMLGVKRLRTKLLRAVHVRHLSPDRIAHVAEKLVRLSPETPQFRVTLGTAYVQLGRFDAAGAQFEEATRLRPDEVEALSGLGDVRLGQGRTDEALVLYTRAVTLRPDLAEAHFGRGNALVAKGELDEALGAFAEAILARPAYPEAHLNMGNVYARRKQPRRARERYLAALELRPDFALAHHALGTLLARQDHPVQAIKELRETVRLAPEFAPAHFQLGRVLVEQGELEAAIAAYREAVRLAPTNAEYADNLAAAWASLGRYDEAAASARTAIAAARRAGRTKLADEIGQRLALYEQRNGSARP